MQMTEFYAPSPSQPWLPGLRGVSHTHPPLSGGVNSHWKHHHHGRPLHAASFAFVATAILISVFLIVAIFERFIRPVVLMSPPDNTTYDGTENSTAVQSTKRDGTESEVSNSSSGVAVLMPGHTYPTFVAHPAPIKCSSEKLVVRNNGDPLGSPITRDPVTTAAVTTTKACTSDDPATELEVSMEGKERKR